MNLFIYKNAHFITHPTSRILTFKELVPQISLRRELAPAPGSPMSRPLPTDNVPRDPSAPAMPRAPSRLDQRGCKGGGCLIPPGGCPVVGVTPRRGYLPLQCRWPMCHSPGPVPAKSAPHPSSVSPLNGCRRNQTLPAEGFPLSFLTVSPHAPVRGGNLTPSKARHQLHIPAIPRCKPSPLQT